MKKYWDRLILLWLALLPWGTVFIIRDTPVEYNKLLVYGTEVLFWSIFVWGLAARYVERPKLKWQAWALGIFLLLGVFTSVDIWLGLQSVRWVIMAVTIGWLIKKSSLLPEKIAVAFGLGMVPVVGLGLGQFFVQTAWQFTWLGLSAHIAWQPGTSVVVGEFGRWLRAYGSFPHPNIFGGYLVLVLLVTAVGVKNQTKQWFWLLLSGLSTVALVFTFSRSAWIGLIFALLIGYKWFCTEQLRLWWATIALSAIVATGLVWPVLVGRVELSSAHEQQSVSERVGGWHEAAAVWRTHPLRGVGLGNYTNSVQQSLPNQPPWTYQPVHNVGLLLLSELGLVGLFLVFMVWGRPLWQARQHWWWVLPIAIIGLFDHYFLTVYAGWLLLGLWVGFWVKFVHR